VVESETASFDEQYPSNVFHLEEMTIRVRAHRGGTSVSVPGPPDREVPPAHRSPGDLYLARSEHAGQRVRRGALLDGRFALFWIAMRSTRPKSQTPVKKNDSTAADDAWMERFDAGRTWDGIVFAPEKTLTAAATCRFETNPRRASP
jgi:hypothetical protein